MKRLMRSRSNSVSDLDDKPTDGRTSSALRLTEANDNNDAGDRSAHDEEHISDLEREASLTSRELYRDATIQDAGPSIAREITLPEPSSGADRNASPSRQVKSPIGIKVPMVKVHEPIAKRSSYAILPNEHLLTSFDRAKTRSANGIRVGNAGRKRKLHKNQTESNSHIPDSFPYMDEERTDTEIVEYKNLMRLFNGTEQQVLYRVNMLIHQHIDLNELQRDKLNDDNFGILHHAVINKFVTVAEKLIDNGATMLDEDINGNTPLHYALGLLKPKKDQTENEDIRAPTPTFEHEYDIKKRERLKDEWRLDRRLKKEKTEKKKASKCDEMAALLISKIKPFRVREIFGDTNDWQHFSNNEDENTQRSVTVGALNASENTQDRNNGRLNTPTQNSFGVRRATEIPRERFRMSKREMTRNKDSTDTQVTDISPLKIGQIFEFMDVLKDKNLKETAYAILDKLVDEDPVKYGESCVYIRLLLNEMSDGGKTEREKTSEDKKLSGSFKNAFHYISKHNHTLANHPAFRALIGDKWKKWAFLSYLCDTILYFLSFIALTICTVVGAQSDGVFIYDSPWQYTRLALEILMCLFILRALFTETLQFIIDPLDYVKSVMNWVELFSAIILIVEIILRAVDQNAHWFVFACGYVLWTVKGLKYAAVTSHTAAYSETLRVIMIRDFWLFALFFIAIEMLFGGTYLLVLKGTNSLDISPDTTTILGIYYVGLRTMIEGGFPIDDYDTFPKIAQAVIIVFMALTIVVMLNILIAQLSNTYETAYAEGQIKSWNNRADAIVNFELEDNLKDKFLCRNCLFNWLCFRNTNRKACCCCCCCLSKRTNSQESSGNQTSNGSNEKTSKPSDEYKLPFNKEELLEEKEKMDEMRSTLKQLDSKLIHADLTIQTIKTRQNVLLQTARVQPLGDNNVAQGIWNVSNDKQHDDISRDIGEMKSDIKDLKNILIQMTQSYKQ